MFLLWGLILSYLIGSFPTAYVFVRVLKGVDIRDYGSGNVGATNASRVLGKGPGLFVLFLDVVKGILPVVWLGGALSLEGIVECVLLGVAVVCGHNWSVFLRFKGGKGIATSLGVLIGLAMNFPPFRPVLILTLSLWTVIFFVTGYVSLSSITAGFGLPVFMILTHQVVEMIILGCILCVFVFLRHIPNIRRLLQGQESRMNLFPRK